MGRFLVLLGAFVLLWHSFRSVARQISSEASQRPSHSGKVDGKPAEEVTVPEEVTGKLVRCAQCGVHVPQERAILDRGQTYCGEHCQAQAAPSSAS